MNKLNLIVVITAIATMALIAGLVFISFWTSQGNVQNIQISQAVQVMQSPPTYVRVVPSNNTLLFDSKDVSVVALSKGHDRAMNLTGRPLPNHSTDNVFVIYGLINPTLVIHKGTNLQVAEINMDEDAYHNFVITTVGPPYSSNVMQNMMTTNWQRSGGMGPGMMYSYNGSRIISMMMPMLSPANYGQGFAYKYTFSTITNYPGNFWYLCMYPGHASSGMCGEMLVLN